MPSFRAKVGFREFLLIVTLLSLIVASVGLRARVGNQITALDHSNRAQSARAEKASFEKLIAEVNELRKSEPPGTAQQQWLQTYFKILERRASDAERSAEAEARLAGESDRAGW